MRRKQADRSNVLLGGQCTPMQCLRRIQPADGRQDALALRKFSSAFGCSQYVDFFYSSRLLRESSGDISEKREASCDDHQPDGYVMYTCSKAEARPAARSLARLLTACMY
jgi:hypothetical protein